MTRKTKKWYVVLVGKCPGVYETWSEVAPLVNGVSGAIHESFNTIEEASRIFVQARDNGAIKAVDRGSDESKPRVSNLKTPPSRESVRASSSRSSPRVLETAKSRRSPLLGSPRNMAEAPLPPTMLHPNVTYPRGSLPSSSHVPHTAERRTSSRSPRVIVRTPSDILSYPSDTEESPSPTALSRTFSDNLSLGRQAPQQTISSPSSTSMKTSQTMDNLPPSVSRPTPYSMEPPVLDVTLGTLDSSDFLTLDNISPLASGPSIRNDRSHASPLSPGSSSCPKCGFMVELEALCFPEMEEEIAPETPLDPRSPLNKPIFTFGSQLLSYESKGRPSPDEGAQPPLSLLLST